MNAKGRPDHSDGRPSCVFGSRDFPRTEIRLRHAASLPEYAFPAGYEKRMRKMAAFFTQKQKKQA